MPILVRYYCCFLLFYSLHSFTQQQVSDEIAIILKNNVDTKEISDQEKLDQLLLLLSKQKKTVVTPEMGELLATIGKQYYITKQNKQAILYFKKAIQIQLKYKENSLKELNKTRHNLAWMYAYEGLDKERYQILQEIIKDNGSDKYTFNAKIDTAVLDANKGDFYLGIAKLNVLLTQYDAIDKVVKIRTVIVWIYGKMYENVFSSKRNSDLQIVKKHHQEIEKNFYKTNLSEDILYKAYNNLAIVYDAFGDLETALDLYLKVKKYYQVEDDVYKKLSVLNNIGLLYAKQKQFKLAHNTYKEIINKAEDASQIATAYDNMGYFLQDSSAEKKLFYFKKAIQILLDKENVPFALPTLEEIRNSDYQQDMLVFLVDLAYFYVAAYKETKAKDFLFQAKTTLYRIDELVSLLRYESNTEESKLFWIEKGVNTYLLAVEVCYYLNLPEEAFYFMEKNKALLLQEKIKTFQAKLAFEIPKKIQEREYRLHYELVALEKLFQQNTAHKEVKEKYASKSEEYRIFMDSLQTNHPQYVQLKKGIETFPLHKIIQTTTTQNTSFITYILNEKDGYGIFCSNTETLFFKIDDVANLQNKLLSLKQYMKEPLLNKEEIKHFKSVNYAVFKALFPFKNADLKIKNKNLIIAPDEALSNLPFEALLTSKDEFSKNYLIQNTAISYLQSFSVLEKIKQHHTIPEKKILAIIPENFKNKKLQPLLLSKETSSLLKEYNSVTFFSNAEATKENFYNHSSHYEIIHLNTHAGIDSVTQTPWIAFYDDKMILDELYGLNSLADLVILDACKTNDGEFASGEGVLNLSRGFFYNGSKSVLASLWNVNEKAGNEIIQNFYSGIATGETKIKALQNAKKKYLNSHQLAELLPYYWASFTLTGTTNKLSLHKTNRSIPIIITVVILLFLIVFIIRRNKTK